MQTTCICVPILIWYIFFVVVVVLVLFDLLSCDGNGNKTNTCITILPHYLYLHYFVFVCCYDTYFDKIGHPLRSSRFLLRNHAKQKKDMRLYMHSTRNIYFFLTTSYRMLLYVNLTIFKYKTRNKSQAVESSEWTYIVKNMISKLYVIKIFNKIINNFDIKVVLPSFHHLWISEF